MAFVVNLASYGESGLLTSNSQAVSLIPITNSSLGNNSYVGAPSAVMVDQINERLRASSSEPMYGATSGDGFIANPPREVTICFESGSTEQYGVVSIGGDNGRQVTTQLKIYNIGSQPSGVCG